MKQKFYGVKITDATGRIYYTEVNVKQTLTHNISVQEHKPIDGKFPYVTQISKPFYWSGNISASFENNQNGKCEHDYDFGDTSFRLEFIEWLHNGYTKKLYLSDELILPVAILGEVSVDTENTVDDSVINTSFQWVQVDEKIYE